MGALDATLGALEIGIIVSIFLYGIATVQVFIYAQSKYKDTLRLRLLVALVWILETLHTTCICILLYSLTVTNYGVAQTIDNASWSLDLSAVLSAWIGAIIQAFFAYRVKALSGRWFIPIISWSLSVLRAALGVVIGVMTVRARTLSRYIERDAWLVTTEFSVCATIDVLNTTSLCYFLLQRRGRSALSHKLIDKIMLWSIETGLLTSITVLVMLICSITMPDNLIYIGILMPYAKLFSNSFLTSLNARRGLRKLGREKPAPRSTSLRFNPPSLTQDTHDAVVLEMGPVREDESLELEPSSTTGGSLDSTLGGGDKGVINVEVDVTRVCS